MCKLAVNTGLSFFFYMLERDPEAKGFLLQSSASVLAELPPLALHAGLGRLELESLAKVQSFLEKTIMEAPHPEYSKPRREDQSFVDHALSSLISFALARGSLGTDLVLARLLFSCPHILKSHHLKQLRCICSISQTWNSDASSSSTSRVRVFRPQPGSPDELVEAWELQVLNYLTCMSICLRQCRGERIEPQPLPPAQPLPHAAVAVYAAAHVSRRMPLTVTGAAAAQGLHCGRGGAQRKVDAHCQRVARRKAR